MLSHKAEVSIAPALGAGGDYHSSQGRTRSPEPLTQLLVKCVQRTIAIKEFIVAVIDAEVFY